MAVSTASLGGTTLPHVEPEGFREEYGYRGADREMLSGAVQTDLISTTAKRTFELSWRELTEAQVTTVKTAFATVDDGAATLVTPLGAGERDTGHRRHGAGHPVDCTPAGGKGA